MFINLLTFFLEEHCPQRFKTGEFSVESPKPPYNTHQFLFGKTSSQRGRSVTRSARISSLHFSRCFKRQTVFGCVTFSFFFMDVNFKWTLVYRKAFRYVGSWCGVVYYALWSVSILRFSASGALPKN